MKLSTLAVAASLVMVSGSVFSKTVVLKPLDEKLETKVCYVAATDGLANAKKLVADNGMNYASYARSVTCNSLSISEFAKTYSKQEESEDEITKVALVAKNANIESQLCLDAVVIGEDAARAKYDIYGSVLCNGRKLSSFVSRFENQDVELRISED